MTSSSNALFAIFDKRADGDLEFAGTIGLLNADIAHAVTEMGFVSNLSIIIGTRIKFLIFPWHW